MATQPGRSPFSFIETIGSRSEDAPDIQLKKSVLVFGSFMFVVVGLSWGIIYLLNQELAGIIPLAYGIISFLSIIHFRITRQYEFFSISQLVLILILPFLLMLALGGYINSSAVILWAFISPIGALSFAKYKQSPLWLAVYLVLLIISGLLQPYVNHANHLPQSLVIVFYVLNLGGVSAIAFVLLYYFVGQKDLTYRLLKAEQDRSEALLLNVLPQEIAERLKGGEEIIADHHPSVSILFADLSGFTPLSTILSPTEMVETLNEIYSHFDSLIEKYGVEKIRTIGDNYMIASGVPKPRSDHAQVLAQLALDMNAYIASLPPVGDRRISFRIGMNSGPVIAGVIGHKKFSYDVWGDAVNIASRMESQGVPGKIQITQASYELIKDDFRFEYNGPVLIKGKGEMVTWFLLGRKG